MHKTTHFYGTSVFGQLISLIDSKIISKSVNHHQSDYYIKKFKTKNYLISMLFYVFAKCTSLRELSGAMLGLSGKTNYNSIEDMNTDLTNFLIHYNLYRRHGSLRR